MEDFKPCAKWTDDCQGKKDYDGRLLSFSTRYWPASYRNDGQPSALASVVLNHGEPDRYGHGEEMILAQREFIAPTEEEVKAQVEDWVETMGRRALHLVLAGLKMTA